jgi:hypothetical protein
MSNIHIDARISNFIHRKMKEGVMSNIHIDARISNFIHRKMATIGDSTIQTSRDASRTSGIYYEPMALPKSAVRKV